MRTKPMEQSPLAHRQVTVASSRIALLNIVLACTSLFMLVTYVVQNNGMAVQVWRSQDAQSRLQVLSDERNGLVAQQASLDDRQRLIVLAHQAGMVPAGAVVYLVQERPVAAR